MKLERKFVEKPWGQTHIPAHFASEHGANAKIGELWFENLTPNPLGLMIKYLFTSEKLSVQVHPDNEQAARFGASQGKEECWYIMDAAPGAVIGVGPVDDTQPEVIRDAALSGNLERLIDWKPVEPGDFFYIPAGTIHAIGPGIQLVEVQQNADITYRLYDYGRPRELHLDKAMAVISPVPYDMGNYRKVDEKRTVQLVGGPYFNVFQIVGEDISLLENIESSEWQILPLSGTIGNNGETLKPGDCGVYSTLSAIDFTKNERCFVASLCA